MSGIKVFGLILALVACCTCFSQNVVAQERPTNQSPAATGDSAAPQRATQPPLAATNDLEITANVTARELRFDVVPDPQVEFTGQPRRDTVWEAERQNLPRPVQPGVTYRNIGVQLRITSVFADIDRIVAEALGEVPVTDVAQPETALPSPESAKPSPESALPPPSSTLPAATPPSTIQGREP